MDNTAAPPPSGNLPPGNLPPGNLSPGNLPPGNPPPGTSLSRVLPHGNPPPGTSPPGVHLPGMSQSTPIVPAPAVHPPGLSMFAPIAPAPPVHPPGVSGSTPVLPPSVVHPPVSAYIPAVPGSAVHPPGGPQSVHIAPASVIHPTGVSASIPATPTSVVHLPSGPQSVPIAPTSAVHPSGVSASMPTVPAPGIQNHFAPQGFQSPISYGPFYYLYDPMRPQDYLPPPAPQHGPHYSFAAYTPPTMFFSTSPDVFSGQQNQSQPSSTQPSAIHNSYVPHLPPRQPESNIRSTPLPIHAQIPNQRGNFSTSEVRTPGVRALASSQTPFGPTTHDSLLDTPDPSGHAKPVVSPVSTRIKTRRHSPLEEGQAGSPEILSPGSFKTYKIREWVEDQVTHHLGSIPDEEAPEPPESVDTADSMKHEELMGTILAAAELVELADLSDPGRKRRKGKVVASSSSLQPRTAIARASKKRKSSFAAEGSKARKTGVEGSAGATRRSTRVKKQSPGYGTAIKVDEEEEEIGGDMPN
ncbi:hypothetical protein P152DRAFT_512685 [Eremomyces bilateralis CBS 781.70]|uniref:Uncharacterized protein n=1 Tax=Eremomyces bilateralis CBS 781.70 TaxID=1392243 RepID=A0A6G1G8H8_9PEZI|nr:uncharacterized protein P152DRAFT_512685 [Eremomyces bilateralis CBS 781.70]KAF1814292.1 hypothetical protein P152DRAFT_512685 [Eremomyces bilateralis CBS 781.70]